jgi:hypothetical protein
MKNLILVTAFVCISISSVLASNNDTILKYKGKVLTQAEKENIISEVYEVIDSNYSGINEFLGFDKTIEGYINEKVTGIKSAIKSNLPDMYISISFDESPSIKTLKELVQQSIDGLKSSGYPITPDRYLTQFVEKNERVFLVVALDETYIYE